MCVCMYVCTCVCTYFRPVRVYLPTYLPTYRSDSAGLSVYLYASVYNSLYTVRSPSLYKILDLDLDSLQISIVQPKYSTNCLINTYINFNVIKEFI